MNTIPVAPASLFFSLVPVFSVDLRNSLELIFETGKDFLKPLEH